MNTRKADYNTFYMIGNLLQLADCLGLQTRFAPLVDNDGRIKGNRVAIREGMNEKQTAFILAHEIAHAALHYDKGNIIGLPEYEEQADRTANLLLKALSIRGTQYV